MAKKQDFHEKSEKRWTAAISKTLGDTTPRTAEWTVPTDCIRVLTPFVGSNNNHAHLPTGGGMDILKLKTSSEPNCLEIAVADQTAYIVRPKRLVFEHIPESPRNSFFLLELDTLKPSGVYEETDGASEEIIEVNGDYLNREILDRGYLGHDEDGDEIPLPDKTKLLVRFFKGKILIVAKGSVWNGVPELYDGRHSKMTSTEIRQFIERRI